MKLLVKISLLSSVLYLSTSSLSFALPMKGDTVTMLSKEGHYSVQTADDTYHSFCLESHQYFSPGSSYTVDSIGDVAHGGGTKRSEDNHGNYVYENAVGGDELSKETKWLFAAYMTDKMDVENQRVQNAIWWLEGEKGGSNTAWTFLQSKYSWDTTQSNYAGWDIAAVNIVSGSGENMIDRQSQLIGTAPVPEPATMLLFGAGLIGLVGVRLKRKK